jgi:hypothetical protein
MLHALVLLFCEQANEKEITTSSVPEMLQFTSSISRQYCNCCHVNILGRLPQQVSQNQSGPVIVQYPNRCISRKQMTSYPRAKAYPAITPVTIQFSEDSDIRQLVFSGGEG